MAVPRAQRARPAAARAQHFLASPALARTLVHDAGVGPGELALDLGAGRGTITAALLERNASVQAVERDPALAALLRARFGRAGAVSVIEDDARAYPLPDAPFAAVANLPFAGAAEILRRLLGDPLVPLQRGVFVVQWEAATRLAAVWPSTLAAVYRGAWYETELLRRLDPAAFVPPPAAAAGVVRVTRRPTPLVPPAAAHAYRAFLQRGFREGPRAVVPRRVLLAAARELGFARNPQARDLDAVAWAALFAAAPSARPARLPLDTYPFKPVQRGRKGVG